MTTAEMLNVPTVSLVDNRPATTSLDIAEHFGKPHKDVLASVRRLTQECPVDFTGRNFSPSEYTDETGRSLPMFTVYFDGFILLVMGYTGKKALNMKLAYIEAFNAMRDELERRKEPFENPDQSSSSLISVTPSSVADRKPLRTLVNAWARVSGQPFDACWNQLKAAFRLTDIRDLPQEWIPDAIAWVQAKVDALPKALPSAPSGSPSSSTEPKTETGITPDLPADMDSGRKDALKRIQRLTWGVHAAHDVLLLSVNPKWNRAARHNIPFEIALNLFRSAEANLVAAYNDLEAGYRLSQQLVRG